jgi:hypothetical protein
LNRRLSCLGVVLGVIENRNILFNLLATNMVLEKDGEDQFE